LHDADHPSLLLLKFIASHSKDARILVVGTYRDTEVRQSPELTRLIGDLSREGHSIPILGLSEAEVGEFVASRSGRKADEKLVADLYQTTDGNPLFVDGVVRLMVAEGKLDRAGAGDAFKIPDGVRESIRRRLVKLPEETNRMLSIASVIGNEVETQLLAQVSGSAAEQIVERMERVLRAGIIIDLATDGSHYRFSHALVREALYQDLPAARRAQLHAEIGAAIREVHKDDLRAHLAALAHHFRAAGDVRNAIDYSIGAADAAENVFAYEDALSHLRPALTIAESHDHDDALRADVLLRLGRIVVVFENHDQGVAYLEKALRIFEQIGDDQHAGEVHSHLGRVIGPFGPQMDVRRGLMHLHRAQTLLGETSEEHSLGLLHWGLAMTDLEAMRVSEALAASQKAMGIFARLGEWEFWARAACNHSQHLMVKGKLARATALIDEIAGTTAAFVNPDAFQHVNLWCSWFWLQMRDPREAMRRYQLGLKRPGHDLKLRARLLEFLTYCEALVGNLTEAKRLATENYVNPVFSWLIAYHYGDWNGAEKALEKALDWARTVGSRWNELSSLSFGVDLRRVTGDYPGAAAAFERALSLYQPDDLFWETRLRPQGVMLYFDTEQPEKAAEHVEYCRKILTGGEDWLGRAGPLWRAQAIVAALQHRLEESDRYFEKSTETCKRYSLPWEGAETLHYWGKALLQAGQPDRAREKLDAAIKIYRDYGCGPSWIDRVEADRRRAQPSGAVDLEATFRNRGDSWTISFAGKTSQMRDAKGLHYLACLLRSPWTEFAAVELANTRAPNIDNTATVSLSDMAENGIEIRPDLDGASPALDLRARAEYQQRLADLKEELEVAERHNDPGRKERLLSESDALMEELKTRFGRGKDLKAASHRERARSTVSKRIRFALDQMRQVNSELAKHLTDSIRTGYNCVYRPTQKINWNL
jgi:tetratricopeptide (TPR) repeat protein